jgi:uridine kinase
VYDGQTDSAVSEPISVAPVDAVLIFEGVFLMRPELIDRWDLRIFVSARFEETVARARIRDAALYGSPVDVGPQRRSPAARLGTPATLTPATAQPVVTPGGQATQYAVGAFATVT